MVLPFRLKIGIAPERRSPDNSAVSARTPKLEVNRMKLYQSIAVSVAFFCSVLYVEAAAKKAKTESEELFAQPQVFEIKIEVPSASLDSLKNDPHKYVRGVVREGSRVFTDAGIRLKGSGSFQPIEKKPSLAIKFNEFISGSRF